MTLRAQVLTGLKWAAGARLMGQVVTWGITIVVMRLLTPGDYGLLSLATIFIAFIGLVAEIGLSAGVIQAREIELSQLRAIFGAVIAMSVLLCLLLVFLLAPAAAAYFSEPRLELVMQVLAFQFLPNAFTVLPIALLERELAFRGRSLIDLVTAIAGSLLTLGLALYGLGVWALVWGTLAVAALRALGLNLIRPFIHAPSFSLSRAGHMFRFSRDVVLTRLLWFFYSQADSFIAGKMLGTHSLGLYSVSMHIASLPVQRVSAIINQIAFAAFARANRESGRVDFHTRSSVRALSFFAFPVLWGMSSVAPEFISVVLGKQWEPAIQAFLLLCLVMPLRMLSPVLHSALQGIGRADVSLRNTAFAAVAMPITFYIGCKFDLVGLALAWVLAFPLVFLGNLLRSLPHLKLQLTDFLAAMKAPALISAVMYGGVTLTRLALHAEPIVNLAVLVTVGVVLYAALSLVFNRGGVREVWAMIAHKNA
jgi:teichuronic acid exporter